MLSSSCGRPFFSASCPAAPYFRQTAVSASFCSQPLAPDVPAALRISVPSRPCSIFLNTAPVLFSGCIIADSHQKNPAYAFPFQLLCILPLFYLADGSFRRAVSLQFQNDSRPAFPFRVKNKIRKSFPAFSSRSIRYLFLAERNASVTTQDRLFSSLYCRIGISLL